MIVDAPQYDLDEEEQKTKKSNSINLQEQSSEELLKLFNEHLG